MAGRRYISGVSPHNRVVAKKVDMTEVISLAGPTDSDLLRNLELEKVS